MKFESFASRETEEGSRQPKTREGQIASGILLGLGAAAAIATSCNKEKSPDVAGQDSKCVPTMSKETAVGEKKAEEKKMPRMNKYAYNLAESLNRYLRKINGGTNREEKKQALMARLDRAEKIVWQERFNGNYDGQKAYFGQIIEDPEQREQVETLVGKYAVASGLPWQFIAGVIGVESGGKQFRIDSSGRKKRLGSDKGAVGLMGVTPIAGVEAGVFKRGELFSRNKEGKEFLDPAKSEALTKRLAEDMDLNARVGAFQLAFLAERYNGDLGLAAAAYAGGIVEVENQLLRIYNARLQREYAGKLKAQRAKSKKGFIQPPKLETRVGVVNKKGGWAKFIEEAGLSIFDLVDDSERYYPTDTYPFEVLALGPVVEEILHSSKTLAETTRLVSGETAEKWSAEKRVKVARE